jgi:hypothetical protein
MRSGMIRSSSSIATDLCVAEEATSTQEEGEEREHGDLTGEGLGRCDADLGSDAEVDAEVGLAGDRRPDDVDHAERQRATLLGLFEGGERVGRLARLAHGDDDRAFIDDRVAIAELAGVLDLGRDFAEVLEEVLADHRGVEGGALPEQDDAAGANEIAGVVRHAAEHDVALAMIDAAPEAGLDRLALLVDLLEHVVWVAAEFDRLEVEFDLLDLRRDGEVVDRRRVEALRRELADVVVVERERLGRVGDDGRGIGADDVLAVADSDDERRALPGDDERIRLMLADDGDGVRAGDLAECGLHRLLEVAVVELADQLAEHLGIGVAREDAALLLEVGPDGGVVLDDAVVDEGDAVGLGAAGGAVGVRVGVGVGGLAMRGPSRVGDADGSVEAGGAVDCFFENADPTGPSFQEQPARCTVVGRGDEGDAGRVVAAVLESFDPFEQERAAGP